MIVKQRVQGHGMAVLNIETGTCVIELDSRKRVVDVSEHIRPLGVEAPPHASGYISAMFPGDKAERILEYFISDIFKDHFITRRLMECQHCRWYREITKNSGGDLSALIRKCHFNPPTYQGFPTVGPYDGCSMWDDKNEPRY